MPLPPARVDPDLPVTEDESVSLEEVVTAARLYLWSWRGSCNSASVEEACRVQNNDDTNPCR